MELKANKGKSKKAHNFPAKNPICLNQIRGEAHFRLLGPGNYRLFLRLPTRTEEDLRERYRV